MSEEERVLSELRGVKQAFKDNINANNVSTSNVEFRDMPELLKQMEKKLPNQTKNVNPTTSEQVVTADSGYKLTQVNVKAVVPSDYYKPEQSVSVSPKTTAQTLTPSGNGVYNRVNVSAVTSEIDSNIIPTNIRKGKTILGVTGNLEADKPDQQKTVNPTTSQQSVVADSGYELAKVTINPVTSSIDSNIKSDNIKKGVSILGVTGTLEEGSSTTITLQEKTIKPTTSKQSVIADAGYTGLSKVNVEAVIPSEYYKPEEVASVIPTINPQVITPSINSVFKQVNVSAVTSAIDTNIQSENIKEGVTILGVVGSLKQSSGGSPKFGELVEGTITTVEETDLNEITTIRASVFENLNTLTNVSIPSNITTIGASAFQGCSNLQTVTLADGITTIGTSAFDGTAITTLNIPTSIIEIGASAFANSSLSEITMESLTPPSVTDTTFPSTISAIYVKYGAYESYLAEWSAYADKIVRLPAIPSTITVTVNNYLGELVSGAEVTISGNGQTYVGNTNEQGVFVQGDLQPATYTISVADIDGFKTPENSEVVVNENTQNNVTITYLEKPSIDTFALSSWNTISEVSEQISANNMTSADMENAYGWKIGDTKDFVLSTGENIQVRIIGVNHDDKSDGSGKAGLTLQMTHCLKTQYPNYNASSNNNNQGWDATTLKNTILPEIITTMPLDLQNAIKSVNKLYSKGGYSTSKVSTSVDNLFLLSGIELFETDQYDLIMNFSGEGNQYEYWSNAEISDTIMYIDTDNDNIPDTAINWWLRSCRKNKRETNIVIYSGGGVSTAPANSTTNQGISFAFCI